MTYQKMSSKPKKLVNKERDPGGKQIKRKNMPITDPLEVGKKDAVMERTRKKTKKTEDIKYKDKMKKDRTY